MKEQSEGTHKGFVPTLIETLEYYVDTHIHYVKLLPPPQPP